MQVWKKYNYNSNKPGRNLRPGIFFYTIPMDCTSDLFPAQVYFFNRDTVTTENDRVNCPGHFLFIFVRSGIFRATVDGKKISCTANELVIALCRHYYQIHRYDKKAICYFVSVQWQFITDIKMSGQFVELLVSRQAIKIFPDVFNAKVLSRIMKLLNLYYQSADNQQRLPVASFTATLSLLIYQAAWQHDLISGNLGTTYSRKELLTMQFLKLVIQHCRDYRASSFYSSQLNVTNGYLNKSVREVTGKTVLRCITEVLISEAKYLLLSSDLTIEAISEQLHFNSSGSFSRFFKKETTIAPTEYRKDYGK